MQPVSWSDLQDFLAIARAGQLARAARTLGVDATTIGRRLRRLETRLGQTLFEQTREGQVPTEAGERLLDRVEAMERVAQGLDDAGGGSAQLQGLIRISVSEGFGTWFVAHHLHEFMDAHPGIVIDLVATSGFLSPSKRETDIAVLLARPRAGPVISGKLADYRLRLYAAERYARRHPLPAEAGALADHRLVGYIPELLYASELHYLRDIDQRLAASVRSSSINAQYRLIGSGAGIGVLPRFIGDTDDTLIAVLPEIEITRSFWLVTHRDNHQLRRIRAFREWLVNLVGRHERRLLGR